MNELAAAIQEASFVLILLPENASDKDYLAALQLQKLAPEKSYLAAPEAKERAWGIAPAKKEFAITVDTARSPVEEIRYEKNNGSLTVFLSHRNSFRRDALTMGEYVPKADLIVTVGFRAQGEAEVAIDALAQKESARHIWLDQYPQAGHAPEKLPLHTATLLGRLMARSREEKELDVLWAFVTKEDFARTASSPADLENLVESFSRVATLPRTALVFWQHDATTGTAGMAWSSDSTLLDRIAEDRGIERKDGNSLLLGSFTNFIEAEIEARKLLRRVL